MPTAPATRGPRSTLPVEAEAAARRAGGRSLDASRDVEIRAAVLELLAEVGYDQLTMEAVASRARAGKGTIYRRWGSKADLVVDAINDLKPPPLDLPDTGSLPGDIRALFDGVALSGPDDAFPCIAGLAAPLVRDRELAAAFREHFVAPRVERLKVILDRAVDRGEITPHPDADLLCAVFPVFMLHRTVIVGEPPDPAFVRRIVEEVLIPLAMSTKPPTTPKGAV